MADQGGTSEPDLRVSALSPRAKRGQVQRSETRPSFWGRFVVGTLVGGALIGAFFLGQYGKAGAQQDDVQKQIVLALQAAPYIDQALNAPIEDLYNRAKATPNRAGDMLSMGLALEAGRSAESLLPAQDLAVINGYRARLVAELAKVPDDKKRDFIKSFPLNQAESAIVQLHQDKLNANFWLGRAESEVMPKEIEAKVPGADGKTVSTRVTVNVPVLTAGLVQGAKTCVDLGRAHELTVQMLRAVIRKKAYDNTTLNTEQRDVMIRELEAQLAIVERKERSKVEVACGGIEAYGRYQPFFQAQARKAIPLDSIKAASPAAAGGLKLKPGERLTLNQEGAFLERALVTAQTVTAQGISVEGISVQGLTGQTAY